ncbi:hypothetical protein RB24_21680 [Herbaspirillum rubrisubalbicans]|uniref:Uncharacterized protein n=1 Tax=Herbaspirillum rubrisubalbicans TaxID=80842 RepID=A0ABX9BWD1_9BURK|nr:hypothetical protein RB24_21680 [Herbaspirillum rubrisubalbicans]
MKYPKVVPTDDDNWIKNQTERGLIKLFDHARDSRGIPRHCSYAVLATSQSHPHVDRMAMYRVGENGKRDR